MSEPIGRLTKVDRDYNGLSISCEMSPEFIRRTLGDPDDPYTYKWNNRPQNDLERFFSLKPPWQSPDRCVMPKIDLFPTTMYYWNETKYRFVQFRWWIVRKLDCLVGWVEP